MTTMGNSGEDAKVPGRPRLVEQARGLNLSEELSSRARSAAKSKAETRVALLEYAGTIPKEDLGRISEAIEKTTRRKVG